MTKFITCKSMDPSLQNTIPSFQFTWLLLEIFDSSSSNTSIRDVEFMTLQVISYHSSIRHHRLVIIFRVCIVYESCMHWVCIVHSSSSNTSIRHSSSRFISSINPSCYHPTIISCYHNGKMIKSEETVKLLGVTLDYRLDFDPHISILCKKAATQLNVLKRLKNFIGFKEKKILVQSFVYSNFNYCPLVWYFSSAKSLQKIEQLQERALRFLYNDHTSSYSDLLLKSDKGTMLVARQRTLCIEIFKTVKHLNPPFMQNIFKLRSSNYSLRNPNNLAHVRPNQTTFGSNSLTSIAPQIWNGLPDRIKSAENLKSFKDLIKQWNGPNCKCSACK